MAEFVVFDWPNSSPTECYTCSSVEGPVVYLREGLHGATWICFGCVRQLARIIGCSDPGVAEALREQLEEALKAVNEMQDLIELERKRQIRVVSLDEVLPKVEDTMKETTGKRRKLKV